MRRVWVCVFLAACASVPPPQPEARVDRVILYKDAVSVLMSDGTLCAVDRPGRAVRWSGVTMGCPHALPVRVNELPDGPREVLGQGGARVIVSGQGWG